MPVTLSQIAEKAGVSRQTASNILNTRGHLFLPETRQRVYSACQELGYRPNGVAKALRSGKFDAVGVISERSPGRESLSGKTLQGIQEVLDARDMHLVLGFLNEAESSASPRLVRELFSDGLIVNHSSGLASGLKDLSGLPGFPVIWMNHQRKTDSVSADHDLAGRMAAKHFLKSGHSSVAMVNFQLPLSAGNDATLPSPIQQQQEGFLKEMEKAGGKPQLYCSSHGLQSTTPIDLSWLEKRARPSALVLQSPTTDLPVLLHRCAELGLSIPRKMSILVITDGGKIPSGLPLDVLEIPEAGVGRESAEMILRKIQKPRRRFPSVVLPPILLPKSDVGTGAPAPSRRKTA